MPFLALCFSCALAAQSPPAAQSSPVVPVAVKSIRYWSLGQVTRVAIELSGEGQFRTDRLEGPDRFFVDILDSRLEVGDRRPQTIKVGDALLKQVRVAANDGRTRVVLDLNGKLETEVSQLANPPRIMIEVRAQDGSALLTAQSRSGEERLDVHKPAEATSPLPVKPAAEQPNSSRLEPPKPAPSKPEPAKAELPKQAQAKPEPVQSAPPKPEPAKAELPKQAQAKPEPVQPEPPISQPAVVASVGAASSPIAPAAKPPNATVAEGVPLSAPPKPAKPRTGGQQSLVRALGLKLGKVVIDPGHGGHDHGTTGPTGLTEKDLVLEVALKLGGMIEEKLGSEVVYTRTTDIFIPLEERTAIANEHKADLFISVHANSSPYKKVSGAEVYYLNFTTSKDALDVAARENAGHGKSIFELKELIQKIALKDKVDESREFAGKLQTNLHGTWAKLNVNARNRGVKKAPFIVLIGASMPSVLTEVGFVSNPKDEQALRKPETRLKIAEALFRGLQQYASTLSEMRVARVVGEVGESR